MNWLKKTGFGGGEREKYQVLLVCTGNTCRTPMAEGILRKKLHEQGAQLVTVKSAGTGAIEGMPASFIGVSVARMHDVNIMSHRSQPVNRKLMDRSDLVLVMAEDHLAYLLENFPQHQDKIHLLRNYGREDPLEDPNIFDPIGSEAEVYELVFQDLEEEITRIVPFIINASMEKMW